MMRDTVRKAAPWVAGLGILLLLGSFVVYTLKKGPNWLPLALLGAGVVLVLSYALFRPDEVRRALLGRQTRYGSNAVILSIAFLGILFFINVLGVRYHKRFDLTKNKNYTLSQKTIQVIENLKQPVEIIGFFSQNDSRQTDVKDLLDEYVYRSHGKIKYKFVDPDTNPGLARQYHITSYGVLLFKQGDRTQQTYGLDEEDITGALVKVTRKKPLVVYFTTGHKEHDPKAFDHEGYTNIARKLGRDNYEVKTINLATVTDTLPSDISVLVIAGPRTPFEPKEEKLVKEYLDKGGKLLLEVDPQMPVPISDTLKSHWGITFDDDIVIDPADAFFGDAATPAVTEYRFSSITKDLGGLTSFFPLARSIEISESKSPTITLASLVETSDKSWGETDLKSNKAHFDPGKDIKGPLKLAASAVDVASKARVVVFGDSDFVSNQVLGTVQGSANPDLFVNAVNWLTEEEGLIAIGPKPPETHFIRPITGVEQRILLYGLVILLPLVVLGAGVLVWLRRR